MPKNSFMKAALEEMEQQEIVEQIKKDNEEQTEILEQDEQVAAVDSAESDIEEHIDYIEEVVGDVSDIQNVSDFTEEAEVEGLDSTTVEILDVATESLYARLGVRPSTNHYANENFGSSATRIKSTKLAIEGFKEFIKDMWEAIKAAFKKMGLYLKHYVNTVFNLNRITILNIEKFNAKNKKNPITASNKALSSNQKLNVVVLSSVYALTSPDSTRHFDPINEGLQKSALVVAKTGKLINTFNQYLSSTDELKVLIKSEDSFNTIKFPKLSDEFEKPEYDFLKSMFVKNDPNKEYFKSANMIGARSVYITQPKDAQEKTGREAIAAVRDTTIKLAGNFSHNSSVNNDIGVLTIDAMHPVEFAELAKTISFVSETIANSEKGYLALILGHDKMIREIDSVEQMLGQSEESYKDYKSRVSSIRDFANSVNRLTGELAKVISGSLVKSCHAAASYTNQSYNAYLKYQ